MKKNLFLIIISLIYSTAFAIDIIPVADIKPGMKGYGLTVFSGTEVERFDIEVVEIIKNFNPQMDLILIKLLGEQLQHTGVVSGMSGSPIYLQDRLAGALSYSLMIFAKDPLAGVTPIEQMIKITDTERYRQQELEFRNASRSDITRLALSSDANALQEKLIEIVRQRVYLNDEMSAIKPLQIPLNISGMETSVLSAIKPIFNDMGFITTQGGSNRKNNKQTDTFTLRPGSAVSGVLMSGDMYVSATGTATMVDGHTVIAFGHPFLNVGPVNIPMAEAKILTILSSQLSSTKLAEVGNFIGNIKQDRSTGVLGILGDSIDMFPVDISYDSPVTETQHFHYDVVNDPSVSELVAVLLPNAVWNSLQSARFSSGNYTLKLNGQIAFNDHESLVLNNIYSTNSFAELAGEGRDIGKAVLDIFVSFTPVLINEFKHPDIKAVTLNYEALPGKQSTKIDKVWYDRQSVVPGEKLTIYVKLKDYRGVSQTIKKTVQIPSNLISNLVMISVGSGDYIARIEKQMAANRFTPDDFDDLIDILNRRRQNDRLYIQVKSLEMGAVIEGQELQALPPSVLNLLSEPRSKGSSDKLYAKLIAEYQVPFESEIFDGVTIRLRVSKHQTFQKNGEMNE
ncbi:hypothetical protein JXB12_06150 [candidate division KSB1 bacterium]|nr:hypothetical protein [candidate division KSB1 bacterium]